MSGAAGVAGVQGRGWLQGMSASAGAHTLKEVSDCAFGYTCTGTTLALPSSSSCLSHHTPAAPHLVAPLMRSSLWFSFRSWWWLPLPLLMISTPARARSMCGA
jgi:hypothetical protein